MIEYSEEAADIFYNDLRKLSELDTTRIFEANLFHAGLGVQEPNDRMFQSLRIDKKRIERFSAEWRV